METDSLLGRGRPARWRALAGAALLCTGLVVLAPRARESPSAAVAPEALGARHTATARPPPHIILVLADDIGHSDVGYSADAQLAQTVRTPTLDALAHAGVRLSRFYSAPGLPATLFIDADGVLQHAHLGEISREVLVEKIENLRTSISPSGDTRP